MGRYQSYLIVEITWHTLYCPLPAKGHNDGKISKLFNCGDHLAYTLLPPASERTQRREDIKAIINCRRSPGIHSTAPCQRKDTTMGRYQSYLIVEITWHTLYCPLPAKGHNDGKISKLFNCGDHLAYTLLPPASERTQRWEDIKAI